MKTIITIVCGLFLAMCACSAVKTVALQPVKIEGTAMEPGLKDGDRIFISRALARIERGDIVIFYFPADQSKSYIKRVVGLPHDRVEIRDIIKSPYFMVPPGSSYRTILVSGIPQAAFDHTSVVRPSPSWCSLWPEVHIQHLRSRPGAVLRKGGEGQARLGTGLATSGGIFLHDHQRDLPCQ